MLGSQQATAVSLGQQVGWSEPSGGSGQGRMGTRDPLEDPPVLCPIIDASIATSELENKMTLGFAMVTIQKEFETQK